MEDISSGALSVTEETGPAEKGGYEPGEERDNRATPRCPEK